MEYILPRAVKVNEVRNLKKEEFGEEINIEEIKRVQLNILCEFSKFCEKSKLRYYLSGGTLLGAIRHKGFIPWDDDIDVNMPRPDLEKLFQITGGKINDYLYIGYPSKSPNHYHPFIRIYDTRTVMFGTIKSGEVGYYTNIYMDVFPIDGLPDSDLLTKIEFNIIKILMTLGKADFYSEAKASTLYKKIAKLFMKPLIKSVGFQNWNKLIIYFAKKNDFDSQKYVGAITSTANYGLREKVIKKDYVKQIDVVFEGEKFKAPANYDIYLSNLYGNYMALPPENQRKPEHNFKAWWKKGVK